MLFPSFTCVDNFLDDPDSVVELSKKFDYVKTTVSPGSRTSKLHELDFDFFNWINLKICTIFYPHQMRDLRFSADTFFQRTHKLEHDNWVHNDGVRFTAILYLNKNNTAGTSIFKPKDFNSQIIEKSGYFKHKYFSNEEHGLPPDTLEKIKEAKELNNNAFEKTFSVEGIYNRLIIFDGNAYHASNPMLTDHERLTLISFIREIKLEGGPIQYPVPTMKSI
tara:strand:- start:328 stop:990 length:663 start_codon:yes stop_codon:yes gene_type:complete